MAQHYFVAVYDDESNTWWYDPEATSLDGGIWDDVAEEWLGAGTEGAEALTMVNERAAGDLVAMLALGSFARSQALKA
jgi:hypothetical protein